jgi:hypothetical protein
MEMNFAQKLTITRPANTTPYTAGDVVGGVLEFPCVSQNGGHLVITDTDLRVDLDAVPSGMAAFRLHLYSATPPSAFADNAAWDLPAGDRAAYLGYIDLGTPVDLGSTLFVQTSGVNKKLWGNNAGGSLFAYMQTIAGYTPTSEEVYALRLNAVGA